LIRPCRSSAEIRREKRLIENSNFRPEIATSDTITAMRKRVAKIGTAATSTSKYLI